MTLYQKLHAFFEPRKDYGAIFLRLIIGWRLVDGTQDNIFSWARMLEFRDFLQHHHVAYPLVAAHVSVYAQFICGILYMLGLFTRGAALIMIINFIAAFFIAHVGQTFQQSFAALIMLFSSVFFLFYGAGKLSLDEMIFRQKKS